MPPFNPQTAEETAERVHAAQMQGLDAAKWLGRALIDIAAGSALAGSQIAHARQLFLDAVATLDRRPAAAVLPVLTPASRPAAREGGR